MSVPALCLYFLCILPHLGHFSLDWNQDFVQNYDSLSGSGWLASHHNANCISLFLCWSSMTYHQSGLEINTIHPGQTLCTIWLSSATSSILSVTWVSGVFFTLSFLDPTPSVVQHRGVWSARTPLSHSSLPCVVSSLPTTSIVVYSLLESFKSPFFSPSCAVWCNSGRWSTICLFLCDIQPKHVEKSTAALRGRSARRDCTYCYILLKNILFYFSISRYAAWSISVIRRLSYSGELKWILTTEQWSPHVAATTSHHYLAVFPANALQLGNVCASHFL